MDKKNSIDFFGASLLIIFSILLGLNQSLVKIVNLGMHPIFQVGIRSLVAAIPVIIFSDFLLLVKSSRAGVLFKDMPNFV